MSTELLLIDLSLIAHGLFHMSANEPDPNWTANRTVARVHALASGKPSGVAVCLDTPPYFRKDIDPAYKANRQEEHNAAVSHQIAVAVDALKADGFPVWGVKGYEADDIIATAAMFHTWRKGEVVEIVIASADKDMYQLISDRVTIQKLTDGSRWDAETLKEKAGIVPNQVVDYLALVGDTSDNIQGAKGIGAKTAVDLLSQCGNLDDLYRALDGGLELKPALLKSLTEFRPRLETARELIRLRTDAPIPFDEIFKERVPVITEGFEDDREGPMDTGASREDAVPDRGVARQPEAETQAEKATEAEVISSVVNRLFGPVPQPVLPQLAKPKPDGPPESTALAPVEWTQALEPPDMKGAWWVAKAMAASKLFSAWGSPEAVLAIIMAGRDFGMSVQASLRGWDNLDGKPAMKADLIRGLILRSGKVEYFDCTERTDERATFVIKRNGRPQIEMSYTIQDARKAWKKGDQSWERSNYVTGPADMLVARCSSKLGRLVCPDVTHGLYAIEELRDVA